MIQDLLGSIASTQAYRRFAAEKTSRTVLYLFFISLLFTVGGSIAMQLRIGPVVDQTFSWLAAEVPTLTFSAGKVTSSQLEPKRLVHPQAPEVAVMIDTGRVEPVTLQAMQEAKVLAYLTNNALYIEQQQGKIEIYDLSKAAVERPMVVDAKFFRDASSALKKVVYPLAILTVFVFAAAWTAFAGLIYALVAMLLQAVGGGTLGFGSLYQIAIHAQTTALLARIVMSFLPFVVPLSGVLTIVITSVYLWLAVKANAAAVSAETSPI
ncbi:MAG: DUF1189 family protein [Elusimicrobiota bacterium]|nr:DUF1189 family protein [Elusimicrobiota bacterium]